MAAAKRRIVFVSGTRADFGKLMPLMRAVQQSPLFECHVFATGMHLLAKYGYTFVEIEAAGFSNVFPSFNQTANSNEEMDFVLANTVNGLGHYVRELHPDMIVVHGDRVEALAGAIVGSLNGILVAHIEGGELSGSVDELIRHAITKLAHVHFVANDESRRRVMQMGERDNAIFVIGSPDIDVMLASDLPSLEAVKERYAIPFEEYGILLYHPVTTELDQTARHVGEIVAAFRECPENIVAVYPNNDSGSDIILAALKELEGHPRFRLLPSFRFQYFLTLLKHARFLMGNSSAGIREAPVYAVPTLNLGSRQRNRFLHESIIDLPEDRQAILQALATLPSRLPPSYHFGRGNSQALFIEILNQPSTWVLPVQKHFHDHQ